MTNLIRYVINEVLNRSFKKFKNAPKGRGGAMKLEIINCLNGFEFKDLQKVFRNNTFFQEKNIRYDYSQRDRVLEISITKPLGGEWLKIKTSKGRTVFILLSSDGRIKTSIKRSGPDFLAPVARCIRCETVYMNDYKSNISKKFQEWFIDGNRGEKFLTLEKIIPSFADLNHIEEGFCPGCNPD